MVEDLVDGKPARVTVVRRVPGWKWLGMTVTEKRQEWVAARDKLDEDVERFGLELVSDVQMDEVPNEGERAMWLVLEARAVPRG